MRLIIEGFESKEQIEEFWSWYSGHGEQSFGEWLDCQEITLSFAPTDVKVTPCWVENDFTGKVKIFYK